MTKEAIEHTILEWEKIYGIKILDPDGFDRSDPKLYERQFTREEWIRGMMRSTITEATK